MVGEVARAQDLLTFSGGPRQAELTLTASLEGSVSPDSSSGYRNADGNKPRPLRLSYKLSHWWVTPYKSEFYP
ncbi:hypothetical protein RRG08_063095 [Elysia crispata]|uniref:Uncharacterized protein n=1 Tax=Elysia crispata TaxID=231223 RepID=A0AAE0YLC2_9GAST|nr:hypothetical protein RRG08_063095 [Elysia crispata]